MDAQNLPMPATIDKQALIPFGQVKANQDDKLFLESMSDGHLDLDDQLTFSSVDQRQQTAGR